MSMHLASSHQQHTILGDVSPVLRLEASYSFRIEESCETVVSANASPFLLQMLFFHIGHCTYRIATKEDLWWLSTTSTFE